MSLADALRKLYASHPMVMEVADENERLKTILKGVQGTITQAMSCIRGETPEDCTFGEAEDDTYHKLRDADAQIDAALHHQQTGEPNK